MQRDGQFGDAKVAGQVPTAIADDADNTLADFLGQFGEILRLKCPDVSRRMDVGKQANAKVLCGRNFGFG